MKIQCPDCGVVVESGESPPGSQFACDNCGRPLTVPADAAPSAPAAEATDTAPTPEAPAEAPSPEPAVFGPPPTPTVIPVPPSPPVFGGEELGAGPAPAGAAMLEVETEETFVLPPDEEGEKAAREAAARQTAGLVDLEEPAPAAEEPVFQAPSAFRPTNPYAAGVPTLGHPPTTGQPYPRGYTPQIVTGSVVAAVATPDVGGLPSFGPPPLDAQAAPFVPGPGLPPPPGSPLPAAPAGGDVGGVNFGAFWFCWLWAACHGLWLWAILAFFIPCLPSIILFFIGNQLAWATGKFSDVEHFRRSQRAWSIAGLVVCLITVTLFVVLPLVAGITLVAVPGLPTTKTPSAQEELLVPPEERGAAREAGAVTDEAGSAEEGVDSGAAGDSGDAGDAGDAAE